MEKTILNDERIRIILALGIMATYLSASLLGFWWAVPSMVTGTLDKLVFIIIGYFFGSSAGSKAKELILKKLNGA